MNALKPSWHVNFYKTITTILLSFENMRYGILPHLLFFSNLEKYTSGKMGQSDNTLPDSPDTLTLDKIVTLFCPQPFNLLGKKEAKAEKYSFLF